MRRCKVTFAAAALVGVLALQGWAGGDDVKAILDKAAKAHFPKGEPDAKKQGFLSKAKGKLHVAGLELDFTQEMSIQLPNKFKEVLDMTVMNQTIKSISVFNGKEGWIKVNDKEIKVEKDILAEFKEVGYMMSLGFLTGLKDKALKLSPLGETQVNSKPALGVKISKEGKRDLDIYFDKSSGLMAKIEQRKKDFMTGQEVAEERIIMEYQEVDGRKMPKKVQVNRDGKKFMEAEILEFRSLEKLDESEFAQP
jgi:hypothetical protein